MAYIRVYGDRHNSEVYAKKIHEKVAEQDPDGLFLESPNRDDLRYLLKTLMKYPTLRHISKSLEINLEEIGIPEDIQKDALFYMDYSDLKKVSEALLKYIAGGAPSKSGMKKIKNPNGVWKSEEIDKAVRALLHQVNVREADNKSTLWSRMAWIAREDSVYLQVVDIDRNAMWKYGANKIRNLPDNPKRVKMVVQKQSKKKDLPSALERGSKKLLNSHNEIREEEIATDIGRNVSAENLRNCAAVVGRAHTERVTEILDLNFNVEEVDVGRKSII